MICKNQGALSGLHEERMLWPMDAVKGPPLTTLCACSYIEEVLGHPAMASMGRMRRRMAVCSLLQLIGAQLCPVLLELKHVAQIMTVAMRALKETKQVEVRPMPTSSLCLTDCLSH